MIKPILFSTPMIQAIIAGRKTQTRRVIKPKYSNTDIQFRTDKYGKSLVEMQNDDPEPTKNDDGTTTHHLRAYAKLNPKFNVGDIIWCRETWQKSESFDYSMEGYQYKADDHAMRHAKEFNINWKPSIFMPKDACRLFLKVTRVRAERLQDISQMDAQQEGVKIDDEGMECWNYLTNTWLTDDTVPEKSFETLWQSINGIESWDENPWVWVYEFEISDKPKDFNHA